MKPDVVRIDEKSLKHFEDANQTGHLLQSFVWKKLQDSLGRKTYFLGVKVGLAYKLVALIVRLPQRLSKTSLYIPRGPIFSASKSGLAETKEVLQAFFDEVKKIAEQENAIYLRMDPAIHKHMQSFLEDFGVVEAPHDMSPRRTIVLDLSQTESNLLAGMKPKTRYNIRLAAKKDVVVKISDKQSDLSKFLRLAHETAKRDKFSIHNDHYYKKQLDILGPNGNLKVFVAFQGDNAIAANLIGFYRDEMIYLHGGSDHKHRNLMAPYALHWAAIEYGKQFNLKRYDLWGIAHNDESDHPWAGITKFKQGFGGKVENYIGTMDIPFDSFWYQAYKLTKKII